LVTGAANGIGRATAIKLAREHRHRRGLLADSAAKVAGEIEAAGGRAIAVC
jgi:NAD(P)-dependent dehydrogenase (short-subunit alcohol dehydrogenase family)